MSYTEYKVRVYPSGNRFWRSKEGLYHREDGPAVEYANGGKQWFINGRLHRKDGPAIEYTNGSKSWYINDLLHREDGPAIEYPDGDKHWYIEGEPCTEEEYNKKMNPIPSCEGREVEIDGKTYILKEKS